jgi:tRNA dimethylallyltransferase
VSAREPLRCVCLAGPTASGKSAAALAIARALDIEIISVDSALVYRGMDIGTAKPTAAERAAVPHHLIDIIEPIEAYSAARFAADARRLVGEIRSRGRLPLLVGGTMLYFKALFDGLDPLPAANMQVRAEIDALAEAEGWPAVHAELRRVDTATAARLAPHDAQRLQRALEVYRITGRPLSALQRGAPACAPPTLIALEPADRAWLHARIEVRFARMLEAGLVDEVRTLRARGDLHARLPSMRCVGYRQVWQALDRGDLSEVAPRAIAATRQLAKRQLTWLRAMTGRRVVACDRADAIANVLHLAHQLAGRAAS